MFQMDSSAFYTLCFLEPIQVNITLKAFVVLT